MVKPEQMKDCGMNVMNMDTIDLGTQSDRVGGAMDRPPLSSPPAIQIEEPVRVVVASFPLRHRHPRPTLHPQITKVLSSSPRRFRSVNRPATG